MKNIFILFTILTILSCSKKESVPEGVIPPQTMSQIITDIYNAEYKASHVGLKLDSSKIVFRNYELKIFDDYQINDSIYKNSFAYYLDHPNKLEAIYDTVIDSLSLQEQVRNIKNKKVDKINVKSKN